MIQCDGPTIRVDWYRPSTSASAPTTSAKRAMVQLPPWAVACAIPIVQSAATARKPRSMCKLIRFKAIPIQNRAPEMSASSPAKVKTADAIRITIVVEIR